MTLVTAASPGGPTPPTPAAAAGARFGPTQAITLIMGSIIGVGIFDRSGMRQTSGNST